MVDYMVPLEPESAQIREVYAQYGLASYLCQVLERGLAMSLTTTFGPGIDKATKNDIDDLEKKLHAETMGRLITRMKSHSRFDTTLTPKLTTALDNRNILTHHYFWHRAASFCNTEGRNIMITELVEIQDQFESLTRDIDAMNHEWMTKPWNHSREN